MLPDSEPISESLYVLPNGLKVTREYFYTGRDRWAYPGPGGLFFVERVSDRYLVIEDNVVVDMASSKAEAERLVSDFHARVREEQEERHQAELDRLSRRAHAARHNARSWPSN